MRELKQVAPVQSKPPLFVADVVGAPAKSGVRRCREVAAGVERCREVKWCPAPARLLLKYATGPVGPRGS